MHKQQGWLQAWEYCQAKLIQTLVRASQAVNWSWSQCIKSHHAQTSSGKGLPSHFWTRDNVRSVLPGLWRKRTQWSKVLFSDESKFCISFGNKVPESGGRVKRYRIHVAWSPVWSFHSQWWFGLPCHLLVLVHCVFWSPQSTQPSTRTIIKRKMRDTRPNNADELKATIKETWASIPPQQCHKLITSMPRRIEAVIKAKGAPTKYWVHIQYINILSRRPTIH